MAFFFVSACSWQDVKEFGGGTGLDLPGLGVVQLCTLPDGMDIEICCESGNSSVVEAQIEREWCLEENSVVCRDTPRHLGPCRHTCDGGAGANAFNGHWCPAPADDPVSCELSPK